MALHPSLTGPIGHCLPEGVWTQLMCQNLPVHPGGCQDEQKCLEGFLSPQKFLLGRSSSHALSGTKESGMGLDWTSSFRYLDSSII